MHTYLDFEKPIAELEGKIQELKLLASQDNGVSVSDEVSKLEQKAAQLLQETYKDLTPWQKLQVARHPRRPHFVDYVERLIDDFTPLANDSLRGADIYQLDPNGGNMSITVGIKKDTINI